ncbi:MAG TPA: NADH-quinone oxidoreductase subunit J, partial [Candidatus Sulfotelmatobacter sp.]|nr:NADH-quinone oxidoreductase subunit J [Candidatus Sulfotelmatobacter sp.]
MAPVATPFFFYLFAAIMLLGGILVITRKNPVHSALALIVTLLAQASVYLMLYAPFVAGVQIILYAGGIMVLFLFVIMLVSIDRSIRERQFNSQRIVGIIAATALGGLFIAVYLKGASIFPEHAMPVIENDNTQNIATMLYGQYMFPFEIASLL